MTRVLACVDGTVQNLELSLGVGSVRVERATPIREFFSWPGKRNYEGLYWSSTNRGHVDFESLLEREFLLSADAATDVVAIAAQPLALLWPRGTGGHHDHVPDFFVRLSNGDGRVVDVRSPERVEKNAEQFALTRKACDEIGWQYDVFTGLPSEHAHNLRWLAGYRHDRNAPTMGTAELIRDCFERPLPLQDGLRRISGATGLSTEVLTANVLHLLWRQILSTDLSRPLSMSSEVWA
ncbi:TnsA-like heteromeric transposase endonuclease subunit [Candidatus Mycolicibacterium alkanivorans]|uniref:TnsA-like heteromeric transposase endonuclease subunit n=1 Tax=Candidatus Mycolicibacterium alkanivorans TaxID=2954114 RepID=A0ABS9YX62_9MYCO|nr:TnsA-like heteromeric transposase endonuclease subunit [Candidatus Mycolicibacterium alkanivorans]MCI4675800.1 TnsA-like heteromeric transposase endonuclease subunit [Candidatus Mycolicibacterium alkanivorans]